MIIKSFTSDTVASALKTVRGEMGPEAVVLKTRQVADAAGKSASIGWVYFVKFLAVVSVSLGVLNLLPVPVLDGGHLVYFLIEGVRGRPLSEAVMLQAQRIGLALLLALMLVAFYVDLNRFLG